MTRLMVTDLDGTLARSDRTLSEKSIKTLEDLGKEGVIRVIATGRTLRSAYKVLNPDSPFDYLLFSTGAGVMDWKRQTVILAHRIEANEVDRVGNWLLGQGYDFMVHDLIPDNHRFHYFGEGKDNPDFKRRCQLSDGDATGGGHTIRKGHASQFLVVATAEKGPQIFSEVSAQFRALSVILATSPLDMASHWVEIFHPSVSKSQSVTWLAKKLGLSLEGLLAVGNDYNDIDLLELACSSYVVANSPQSLLDRFSSVASNDNEGFSEAVGLWKQNPASRV